ncbi:MAG: NlpC/P60 family protein [Lachnospiraceae bacterium]
MKKFYGFNMRVKSLTAAVLLGSMICRETAVPVLAAGQNNIKNTSVQQTVNLEDAGSIAGVAVNLKNYYNAVEANLISTDVEHDLAILVNEKASVLDHYENLGIVDVSSKNYLNVRKKASKDSDICGKMLKYSACEILDKEGDWYKISSGSVKGYVHADYVITGEKAEQLAVQEAELTAVVTTKSNLNVRKEPSADSEKITKISTEERYTVISQENGWVKIELDGLVDDDGKNLDSAGYVSADYCEVKYDLKSAVAYTPLDEKGTSSYSSRRASLCNYACQFVGNRYVWGGTSLTRGADCSGFVMSVFKKYGVSLTHSSRAQARAGKRISASQMRPGDLVFYGKKRIDHVAIYIGNGKIVHAANTRRGIVINRWNYMTPVRIVNVLGD